MRHPSNLQTSRRRCNGNRTTFQRCSHGTARTSLNLRPTFLKLCVGTIVVKVFVATTGKEEEEKNVKAVCRGTRPPLSLASHERTALLFKKASLVSLCGVFLCCSYASMESPSLSKLLITRAIDCRVELATTREGLFGRHTDALQNLFRI